MIITGGAGFIGSFVAEEALKSGFEVHVFDNLSYSANNQFLKSMKSSANFNFQKIDICNFFKLRAEMQNIWPCSIVHLAAETHVDNSIDRPEAFVKTNIGGTYNLLEAFRACGDKYGYRDTRFLHISTDEVYGSLDQTGLFNEQNRYEPSSPYSATKAASDHLVHAWFKTYGLPSIVTNCSNNYGPRQHSEKLIPKIIDCLKRDAKIPIYGNGENIRDWLFVRDHAKALLKVYEHGKIGTSYCIGGTTDSSNLNIVENIVSIYNELTNNNLDFNQCIEFVEDRLGHDFRYAIDASKLKRELGWQPQTSLELGLTETVEWYLTDNDH